MKKFLAIALTLVMVFGFFPLGTPVAEASGANCVKVPVSNLAKSTAMQSLVNGTVTTGISDYGNIYTMFDVSGGIDLTNFDGLSVTFTGVSGDSGWKKVQLFTNAGLTGGYIDFDANGTWKLGESDQTGNATSINPLVIPISSTATATRFALYVATNNNTVYTFSDIKFNAIGCSGDCDTCDTAPPSDFCEHLGEINWKNNASQQGWVLSGEKAALLPEAKYFTLVLDLLSLKALNENGVGSLTFGFMTGTSGWNAPVETTILNDWNGWSDIPNLTTIGTPANNKAVKGAVNATSNTVTLVFDLDAIGGIPTTPTDCRIFLAFYPGWKNGVTEISEIVLDAYLTDHALTDLPCTDNPVTGVGPDTSGGGDDGDGDGDGDTGTGGGTTPGGEGCTCEIMELGEFTFTNNANQQGWLIEDEVEEAFEEAKFLLLQFKEFGPGGTGSTGVNEDGIGGITIIQESPTWSWTNTNLTPGWTAWGNLSSMVPASNALVAFYVTGAAPNRILNLIVNLERLNGELGGKMILQANGLADIYYEAILLSGYPCTCGEIELRFDEVSEGVIQVLLDQGEIDNLIDDMEKGTILLPVDNAPGLPKGTISAILPIDALEQFLAAEGFESVSVRMPDGVMTIPKEALNSILDKAGDEDITLTINAIAKDDLEDILTKEQLEKLPEGASVFQITLFAGDTQITEFEGFLRISLRWAGRMPAAVWLLKADGTLEARETQSNTPLTGWVQFDTPSLSIYIIQPGPSTTNNTGVVTFLSIAGVLLVTSGAGTVIVARKLRRK